MARNDAPLEDEEAFHWAGDEFGGREGAHLPDAAGAENADDDTADDMDAMAGQPQDVTPAGPALRSARAMRLLAVLFGVGYLALTVGWILGVQYTGSGSTDLVTEVLWQFGEFTAIVAAPLWFGATLTLTRTGRPVARAGWLALGAGLLLPWPLLPLLAAAA